MIVKIISRVGIIGSRSVRRVAQRSLASPNAQLGNKLLTQQANQARSFTVLASPNCFNKFAPLCNPILSTEDLSNVGTRRLLQTKGDKDLVEFLDEEISAEKKSQKKLPDISPFQASFNDAEVILTQKINNETIVIKFNINNSVETSEPPEENPQNKDEEIEMVSRPNFSVEIERGGKVLSLACSFSEPPFEDGQPQQQPEEEYDDLFTINEMSLYEGDFEDTTYSTSGDILDGYLYDLLISMLEARGITTEFVEKISEFSTVYEQQRYLNLLQNLQKFFN